MIVYLTGVSGSLGKYLASYYLRKNFIVVGFDCKDIDDLEIENNKNFKFYFGDLTDIKKTKENYISAKRYFGSPDVLINNAGVIYSSPIVSVSISGLVNGHDSSNWINVINSTLTSAFHMTVLASQDWVENIQGGVIVNISSISAQGNPGQAAYSAAKAGIEGLTIACSKELAQYGIRCVAIAPGFMNTESTSESLSKENIKKITNKIPMRRFGNLDEISSALDFVITNQYVNGAVIKLDGGLTI